MEDLNLAAQQVASFLKTLTTTGGLRLKYRITAGAGAADPDGLEHRDIYVEIAGPDAPLLTDRGGELLRALEQVAAGILRLEPEEQERVSFDALAFKATRARAMLLSATTAADHVRLSGRPYIFPSMTSGERRMLHMALRNHADLRTESSGEGRDRRVVAYPANYDGTPVEVRRSSSPREDYSRRRDSGRGFDRPRRRDNDRAPIARDDHGEPNYNR